ncbi:LRR amino-terminal domain protein [Medicago truncatula]|uniref:LRR amino-terminal domain protein n=1 Tax=Medicago truncatula TaxID=3880 RepID=G7ZVL6_MEDTR|nr:LRR amino-terminal domain protein [Medicago truncatula]
MVNLSSHLFLFSLSVHCCVIVCLAANTKNITTDQYALLAFKSLITSDPYDVLANNWSTSSSVCNWIGVTCDERHGRVHSLILRNMSQGGTVSPNLGNLSFLVILDLKNNRFGGQFPKELCSLNLSQLQYLYLGANNFNGFIPQSIGNLHGLIELDTIQNKLSGPIPQTISNMSSIEVLHLSSNYFSEHIPEYDNIIRLKSCYNKYLTASNQPLLLGVMGQKVIQTLPRRLDSSVEWEGAQVKLKTRYGNFLRGNGGLLATQDWILWDVDVLEIHVGNPPPPPPIPHSDSLDFGSSTPSALSFKSDRFSR